MPTSLHSRRIIPAASGGVQAVPLPYTKRKLQEVARELYSAHGWKMPRGFADSTERNPRNFTLAE